MSSKFHPFLRMGVKTRAMSLDDFNGTVRTLNFVCSANKAFIEVYNDRLSPSDLEDVHRTGVHTGSASITFLCINFDFNRNAINLSFGL